jgi:subtilisin family serine protease
VIVVALLAALASPGAASAAVAADVTTAPATSGRVIVAMRDGAEPPGARVLSRQPNLGTFTVEADSLTVARLRDDPRVVAVAPDRELRPALAESAVQVHADAAWSLGLTGAGQTLAVIDTGVDGTHPMLSGRVVDEACFTEPTAGGGACPNGQATQFGAGAAVPCAIVGCDHGTHVASIAAGRSFGARRGIASDATVVAVQVFTPTAGGPSTSISEVLAAFEWVFAQRNRFAIAAINLSVASATVSPAPCADDVVEQAVQRLATAGIAVVAAAGNSAAASQLSYPACVPGIVSVSSVGGTGAASPFANRAAALSLFAPGESVAAAAPGGSTSSKSGTSQAAPHVSGAFALFRQRQSSVSVGSLVTHLDRTADAVIAPDGRRAAAGMLRIDRALDPRYDVLSVAHSRTAAPLVALQSFRERPGRVELSGTIVDPASVLPATLTAFIDGLATVSAAAVTDAGDRQQFTLTVPLAGGRQREFCLDVRGARALVATRVVCVPVRGPDGQAFGSLDVVETGFGTVVAHGWAIDPNVSTPVEVHVYVDGVLVGGSRADRARGDVGAAHTEYGDAHGFSASFVVPGAHELCVYAIDADDDANALIGCRRVAPASGAPFGSLDVVRSAPSSVTVAGWAIDPDTRRPIEVHLYADGRLVGGTLAGRARGDVDGAHPVYAPDHGFELTVSTAQRARTVCAYGINVGPGTNALLGCRMT